MTAEMLITTKLTESLEIKLNLGCGKNKINGFCNIDAWAESNADMNLDFTKNSLPFEENSVTEVCFFHTIEHIEEKYHVSVLSEIYRVLKPEGIFTISYPEFLKCVEYYEENKRGQRDFFKLTIFGRQAHIGDFHVSLMDTKFFKNKLTMIGFKDLVITPEPYPNEYNTIIRSKKGDRFNTKTEILKKEIF